MFHADLKFILQGVPSHPIILLAYTGWWKISNSQKSENWQLFPYQITKAKMNYCYFLIELLGTPCICRQDIAKLYTQQNPRAHPTICNI